MAIVYPFRPRATAARAAPTPSPAEIRAAIEQAAQACLDAADTLIAVLDRMDGDADREDGGDAEPDLGAPENHTSQVAWFRGTTRDLELDQHQDRTR